MLIDTLSNRKMLMMALKNKGIPCDMLENGLQAVESNLSQYSLIFLDNLMPVMVRCNLSLIDAIILK